MALFQRTFSTCLILAFLAALGTAQETAALTCPKVAHQPAATLLFPYFEVDFGAPLGRSTLLSISNTADNPTLAQVVLWTNCSLPVLSFTVFLEANGAQSLNVRDLIAQGKLPDTFPTGEIPFPGCTEDLLSPTLDEAERKSLAMRLLGQPDPDDGLCYARAFEDELLATGYLTVDVLNDCSSSIRTPLDKGYFSSGGTGLASNANVLTGDFFLVDGLENAATGLEAVAVVADAEQFSDEGLSNGFYPLVGTDRLPLGSRYRARFLQGGAFDGGTDLLLWYASPFLDSQRPLPCEVGCGDNVFSYGFFATAHNEQGSTVFNGASTLSQRTVSRISVGSEDLPIASRFGALDVRMFANCGVCSPPNGPIPGWILPIYSAQNGFSVGLNATQLEDQCF